jgi:glycine cleavage system aminomethyltransferase T/glycine/D-amino acid oxidase-like deaminating enzyme
MGVDVREITPAEVKDLFPLAKVDDILAGYYVPDDGRVNPVDVTMAMARGARMHGAEIYENTRVARVETAERGARTAVSIERAPAVTGVITEGGQRIECDYVINCAGMWARQLAARNGVSLANQAAEHYYLITEPMDGVDASLPVLEDPSSHTYIRPEGGGLLVGLFEPKAAAWSVDAVADDFAFGEIDPDWERMTPFLQRAMARVPATETAGIKKFFCGPESFTPDLAPQIGESPEVRNYFVAAGLNSIGILTGGGIGKLVANWVATGAPDMDVTGMNVDRVRDFQTNAAYRAARVVESLGNVYKCHYPYKENLTARGVKRSAIHDRLAINDPHFLNISGYESPGWYRDASLVGEGAGQGPPGEPLLTWDVQPSDMFAHWRREHNACRDGVVLMDMSFMSRFLVRGTGARRLLDRLCTAAVGEATGSITYTQMLNARGTLEADVTVMNIAPPVPGADPEFIVIATDTAHRHVETLLRRGAEDMALVGNGGSDSSNTGNTGKNSSSNNPNSNINSNSNPNPNPNSNSNSSNASGFAASRWPLGPVSVTDVTSNYAQMNIQGPRARDVLAAAAAGTDMSNEAFPFRAARWIDIGLGRALCTRITYVGELGYELHVPAEYASHVFDAVAAAGKRTCKKEKTRKKNVCFIFVPQAKQKKKL